MTELDPSVPLGADRDTDHGFRVVAGEAIKEVVSRMTHKHFVLHRGQEEGVLARAVECVMSQVSRTWSTSTEAAVYASSLAGPTRMGLGCMALTGVYGHVPRRQAVATIKAALSVGVRLFDTAPLYGDGANEELLGEQVAKERNVCIVTKFGLYSGRNGKTFRNSNPSAVRPVR